MANISSMSSWLSQPGVGGVTRHLLPFVRSSHDGPEADNSGVFLCPLVRLCLTPVLRFEDSNRLLRDWKRVLSRARPLIPAEGRPALGSDLCGDEAQQAFCLKARNFLWTLRTRTNYGDGGSQCLQNPCNRIINMYT